MAGRRQGPRPGARPSPAWATGSAGNIHASAVCLDADQNLGAFTDKAPDPGSKTINLTNVSGATCGTSGINGHFDAALGDWDDSVDISTVNSQFKLNLANGKRGYATCMK